jgi:predicted phosphate transport protein (TIGR00153 family)
MFNIKPKDKMFFDLFSEGVKISNESAKELRALMDELRTPDEKLTKLSDLEHDGDTVTHKLLEHTKKMFITPLDREDIVSITREIDNVTDNIEAAAHRFYMYSLTEATPEAVQILDKLVAATESLMVIISELKTLNKSDLLLEKIIHVNTLENEADQIYRKAIKNLFSNVEDVLHVMKWKDIYKYLEDSMDACEKLANEVRGVVMKYA